MSAPGRSRQPGNTPQEVRRFLAEIRDGDLVTYDCLEEARADPDAAVVLSGDYGGTIFLTAPVWLVACTSADLTTLVSDLDAVTWMSGDLTIATVSYERHRVGSGVSGGDGGGIVIGGVWTHPRWLPAGLAAQATQVVLGERQRIDLGLLRQLRAEALARQHARRGGRQMPRDMPWDFDVSEPAVDFPHHDDRPGVRGA